MPGQDCDGALQAWLVRTNALRRTFVSVKGFYFQAEVVGQPVTWLVPHALSQVRTSSTQLPPKELPWVHSHSAGQAGSIC